MNGFRKKNIPCPVCSGYGFVWWVNDTDPISSTGSKTCIHCNGTGLREVDMTNADRIRAMSDEELVRVLGMMANGNVFDLICDNPKRTIECDSMCVNCIAEWIKQPVEEDDA